MEIFALVSAAMFFGAAIYVSLAEQPARLTLATGPAVAQWKPSYKRGYAMQGTLAMLSALAGSFSWWRSGDVFWLVGAGAILANWPYTFIVMLRVNHRLEAIAAGSDTEDGALLLRRWGRLHAVRSALGGLATFLYAVALLQTS